MGWECQMWLLIENVKTAYLVTRHVDHLMEQLRKTWIPLISSCLTFGGYLESNQMGGNPTWWSLWTLDPPINMVHTCQTSQTPPQLQPLMCSIPKLKQQLGGRFDGSGLTGCLTQLPEANIANNMESCTNSQHHTHQLRMVYLSKWLEQQ